MRDGNRQIRNRWLLGVGGRETGALSLKFRVPAVQVAGVLEQDNGGNKRTTSCI